MLQVYNIISQDTRVVQVDLTQNKSEEEISLGVTIRFECYADAHNNILAVKDVYLDSPAADAGLISYQDYILGTREICFKSLDEFAKYITIN